MADAANQPAAKAPAPTKQAVKPTPLRDDFERKANALQRKNRSTPAYDDYDDDEEESSDPEFVPAHRQGKRRIFPVRQSRITDRPISGKEPTMSIKIELDLEVEVEIYARVKGDVTIGLV